MQSMFAKRLDDIREKLDVARTIAGSEDWFGVNKHHFHLRPPLPARRAVRPPPLRKQVSAGPVLELEPIEADRL